MAKIETSPPSSLNDLLITRTRLKTISRPSFTVDTRVPRRREEKQVDRGPISAREQLQGGRRRDQLAPFSSFLYFLCPLCVRTINAHHLIVIIDTTKVYTSLVWRKAKRFRFEVSAQLSISTLLRPGGVLSARHGSHDLDRAENGERWTHEKNQLISIEATVRARKGNFQFVAAPKPRARPPGVRNEGWGGRSLQWSRVTGESIFSPG